VKALEIVAQVVAGLAAVHEQNLVHRDIKPSNILVRLKDDGGITVKIIDLGLAKAVNEPSAQTAINCDRVWLLLGHTILPKLLFHGKDL
jgi:serine/threonine protein kinase